MLARALVVAIVVSTCFALPAAGALDRSEAAAAVNGLIAFVSNRPVQDLYGEIYAVRASGGPPRNLSRFRGSDHGLVLSPDGRRVAFLSNREGFEAVYVAGVDGVGLRRVTPRFSAAPGALAWAPDGRRLAFGAGANGLFVADLRNRRLAPITADGVFPEWSPRGNSLAYVATEGRSRVVVVRPNGRRLWSLRGRSVKWAPDGSRLALDHGSTTQIASSSGKPLASVRGRVLSWSPDSRSLAFVRGSHLSLYLADRGGRVLRRLTFPDEVSSAPVWSPDGTRVAFAGRARSGVGTFIASVRGRLVRRILPSGAPLAWSPDGRRLLLMSPAGLVAVSLRGGHVRTLVRFAPDAFIDYARFALGGRAVVYRIERQTSSRLFTMGVDGGNVRALTRDGLPVQDPAWSPDGRRIAYSRSVGPGSSSRPSPWELYAIAADGSDAVRITEGVREFNVDSNPAWSPDGRRIAFQRSTNIYLVNADGSGLRHLTRGADPAWSPDGRKIAFAIPSGGDDGGIYAVDQDGRGLVKLTGRTGSGAASPSASPAWSPDGSQITFGGSDGIYVMASDGSGKRRVTGRSGIASVASVDWSPDGALLVFDDCSRCGAFPPDLEIYVVRPDGTGRRRLTNDPASDAEPSWQPVP